MTATPRPYLYQDLEYLGGAGRFAESIFNVIGQNPFYEGISRHDCDLLCQFMHCFEAPQDSVLLTEGVEGDFLIIILSGQVSVSKQDVYGKTASLAMVGPGSVLGEMSLIDGEHRFATCVSQEPVMFAVLTRDDLKEILFAHPRLANKLLVWLLQIMINRVRDADVRLLPVLSAPLA